MSLTDTTIRNLKPPQKGQKLYTDNTLAGFGVRVSAGGSKSFIVQIGTDRRKVTIGRYPIITLAKAREEARRLLAEHTLGKVRPQSITYTKAIELFLEDKRRNRRPSTVRDYERLLSNLGFKTQLSDISHEEAARRINRIKAPSERNHSLTAAKVFWNWCVQRRYVSENPLIGLSKAHREPRNRTLTDDELKAIWLATEPPTTFNKLIRLCILTAQRRGELAKLQPTFLKDGILTIPPTITKNRREHQIPLSPWAQEQLTFTPFFGWGKSKTELDKESQTSDWTIHDIRRTVATRMAELGVPPHVIERILNHVTGQGTAVARVYNRHHYLSEMSDAFQKWETALRSIVR